MFKKLLFLLAAAAVISLAGCPAKNKGTQDGDDDTNPKKKTSLEVTAITIPADAATASSTSTKEMGGSMTLTIDGTVKTYANNFPLNLVDDPTQYTIYFISPILPEESSYYIKDADPLGSWLPSTNSNSTFAEDADKDIRVIYSVEQVSIGWLSAVTPDDNDEITFKVYKMTFTANSTGNGYLVHTEEVDFGAAVTASITVASAS